MHTTSNNFTVEALVVKYRNYVMDNCPESENADKQLLVTLYNIVAGSNADEQVLSALSEYSEEFMEAGLEQEELAFLCEHFSEVVIYEFSNRDSWNTSCSFWEAPSQIYNIIENLASPQFGQTIFVADAGYGDIATMFPNCTVKGFSGSLGDEIWALGQIRLYAAGINSEIINGSLAEDENTDELPKKGSVDIVIYGNVWLQERRNLQELYCLLKEGGKMLILLDRGALVGKEYEFNLRQQLIKDKSIQTIISFENDREPDGDCDDWFSSDYILLYVEKLLNQEVHLINLKKQTSKIIDSNLLDPEILWPSYYDAIRPQNGIPFSKLVIESSNTSLFAWWTQKQWKGLAEDAEIPLILPNNLGDTYIDANIEHKQIDCVKDSPSRNKWVADYCNKPCVLIGNNTKKLKVGYISHASQEGFAYYGSCCLIPQDGIDVRYITALLLDTSIKNQILTVFDGVIWDEELSFVLDKIIVPNHNEKERLNYLAEVNYEALISSQEKLKQEAEHYKKTMRMHKHILTQPLSAARSMFNALNIYRKHQNGCISDNEVLSEITGITVQKAFEFISKNFKDGMVKLEHIAEIDYSFDEPMWIAPNEFIENYIAQKEKEWMNFKLLNGNKGAKFDKTHSAKGKPKEFLFPEDALECIFNEIIANAQVHGFTDETRKDYQVKFSWHTDGLSLIIEIENNGMPIPENCDTTSLLECGVSGALYHNGIGCHNISYIMQRYGGMVKIDSFPEKEFTVKYVLTFTFIDSHTPSSNC